MTFFEPVAPAGGRGLGDAAAPSAVALARRVPAEAGEIAGVRSAVLALAEELGMTKAAGRRRVGGHSRRVEIGQNGECGTDVQLTFLADER